MLVAETNLLLQKSLSNTHNFDYITHINNELISSENAFFVLVFRKNNFI